MSATDDRRDVFLRGLEAYRAGQHYEAHELWEAIWQDEPDEDKTRFLQALIQLASAVHKARNDVAPKGSLRLVERAIERLALLPDRFLGVDVAALREESAKFHAVVAERIAAGGPCRLPAEIAPPIALAGELGPWGGAVAEPRVPDVARSAYFERGLGAYCAGEFFEAHELWEELWRDEKDDDHKQFLQGLIQVAAAMHKIQAQRNPEPAGRLLQRAMVRLSVFPPHYFGIRVDQLLVEARRAQQALTSLARAGDESATLEDELVPTITRLR